MPQSRILTQTVERLSRATSLATITDAVSDAARRLVGADGASFVLKDEDRCYYADENAISPLWKGKRFPAESCVSGWCMKHRQVVAIRDIYQDIRVPVDAYRPTFVRSLCLVPVRSDAPIGAIGTYWAQEHELEPEEIKFLQILANSSATALENLELREMLSRRDAERKDLQNRQRELEFQLNSMAHDLRNPLTTMMGLAELLQMNLMRNESGASDKSLEYIGSILRTGGRLNHQIDRMLTLYRLSNNNLRRQPINISEMAMEVSHDLQAHERNREFDIEIAPGLRANADPELTRLALENLISNAFKYSRRKPRTWLRIDRVIGEKDAFSLEDRGEGFDPSMAVKLFQPLVRLHRESEFPGTGLGLASVARIIELHGGKVWAEGRPAEGATFYFTLPSAS